MATKPESPATYETDVYGWAMEQAALLRARSANAIDWENVAEEIESVGRSERREIISRLEVLIEHLIKLAVCADAEPRRGWWSTVRTQRIRIADALDENPSLRPHTSDMLDRAWRLGCEVARAGLLHDFEREAVPANPFLSFDQAMTLGSDEALRALLTRT